MVTGGVAVLAVEDWEVLVGTAVAEPSPPSELVGLGAGVFVGGFDPGVDVRVGNDWLGDDKMVRELFKPNRCLVLIWVTKSVNKRMTTILGVRRLLIIKICSHTFII